MLRLTGGDAPVTVPVATTARYLIFAHRQISSQLLENGPVGVPVAHYRVRYSDGAEALLTIRERFEIATVPSDWGQSPFLALNDQPDYLLPRWEGAWGGAGERLTDADLGGTDAWYLWPWPNPRPEEPIASLTISSAGPAFALGGITLGHLDEEPFNRDAGRLVRVTLPQADDAATPHGPGGLEVSVDRGLAYYPYPLPAADAQPIPGFGEPPNTASSPQYLEIAAAPSATVRVSLGGAEIGAARWRDIEAGGLVVASPRVHLELIDSGRNWVRTTVLDADSGERVPCRVHFRSAQGVPFAPHGHHAVLNGGMDTWHVDVGGDLRMGQSTYAYIDGSCEGWLPRGEVRVDVARGFEYEPLQTTVTIAPGQQELTLRLKRFRDMNAERWFSGDTHVHFLSTVGSQTEARGEDLNVVNLLMSQWGHLFTNTEEFTGEPHVSRDGKTIVYATQENRQHMLGHMTLLGLTEQIAPWGSGGPSEAELAGTLETTMAASTMAAWADEAHRQGGTVILPHLPTPNGEPAALIATGRVDAVEMIRFGAYMHNEYYRYLNNGYRLQLVGGTDKMSAEVPVGLYRTYVHIPDDEEFSYASWLRNLRRGRTTLSGGPLIDLRVAGHLPGDTLALSGNGGTVEVLAEVQSVVPVQRLELVQQGRVIAATDAVEQVGGHTRLRLRENVRVDSHSWIAARAGGPGYYDSQRYPDTWTRGIVAHTSPVYISVGGEWDLVDPGTLTYMETLVQGSLAFIRTRARRHRPGTVTHRHGEADHAAFLERPFLEALDAIHRRMHALGLEH
ncbi:MAG: hypothetical protein DCC58_16315 [Chloroflexi bacterium]|nr:MAG: hypothetical protein DCC58_16315 [Chloroflexota bacterium]